MSAPETKPELPDWAIAAMKAADAPRRERTVAELTGDPAWPLLVDAAVVSSFLPSKLGRGVSLESRADAERTVLRFSEPTMEPDGMRWSLTPDARQTVVRLSRTSGELPRAFDRTSSEFGDSISEALRDCLRGSATTDAALPKLEARRIAVRLLAGVEGIPSPDQLDRDVILRRQFEKFERMVGADRDGTDHFYGRADEMEQLRRAVGVIAAESFGQTLTRGGYYARTALLGRRTVALTGTGGTGKTTLIAKFMLEHARVAASRFPFAYIDFDRPTISARNLAGILAEMCVQAAAQFPDVAEPLLDLRDRVTESARRLGASPDADAIGPLADFIRGFREIVDAHLAVLSKRLEWERPYLLLFDTFEVAQYSPDDIIALEQFVAALGNDDRSGWSRLRLILAGRRPIARFVTDIEPVPLGSLDDTAAIDMLIRLARDGGAPLERRDARALVDGIKKIDRREDVRLKPQRIRLLGQQFTPKQRGSDTVKELLDALHDPRAGTGITQTLIDGILVRRTLVNVADDRVRALANPGLVVRRITPEVIRLVMTPATPRPAFLPKPEGDPAPPGAPWIVSEAEAKDIFDAFAKEVTLVDVEGGALRHRQDVRQDTLPLMRADPSFARLSSAARDYYRSLADREPANDAAAAEAVYHGLWAGDPLETVDRYWHDTPSFDPRIDATEFNAGSLQDLYLSAKTHGALTADGIKRLPRAVGIQWVAASGAEFIADRRPAQRIDCIKAAAGDDFSGFDDRPDLAAIAARLLMRCGRWDEVVTLTRRRKDTLVHDISEGRDGGVSLARSFATVVCKSALSGSDTALLLNLLPRIAEAIPGAEVAAHLYLDPGLVARGQTVTELHQFITRPMTTISRSSWTNDLRALRLVLLAEDTLRPRLIDLYMLSTERLPREPEALHAFAQLSDEVSREASVPMPAQLAPYLKGSSRVSLSPSDYIAIDRHWRAVREQFAKHIPPNAALTDLFMRIVAFQHSDWTMPIGNAITAGLSQYERLLREFDPKPTDGIRMVEAAIDSGRLLELASVLAKANTTSPGAYPRDAPGLADALLRWHAGLMSQLLRKPDM